MMCKIQVVVYCSRMQNVLFHFTTATPQVTISTLPNSPATLVKCTKNKMEF